jgi:hypothetical protein
VAALIDVALADVAREPDWQLTLSDQHPDPTVADALARHPNGATLRAT